MTDTTTRRELTAHEEDLLAFNRALKLACDRVDERNYGRPKAQREWLFDTRSERYAFARSE
jgi:hypothetical protein